MRNKRAERCHSDLAGKTSLMKFKLGHWKPSDKGYIVEMRNSGQSIAISAKSKPIELTHTWGTGRHTFVWTIQYSRAEQLAVLFCLDREMTVTVALMDRRPVTDAPIA